MTDPKTSEDTLTNAQREACEMVREKFDGIEALRDLLAKIRADAAEGNEDRDDRDKALAAINLVQEALQPIVNDVTDACGLRFSLLMWPTAHCEFGVLAHSASTDETMNAMISVIAAEAEREIRKQRKEKAVRGFLTGQGGEA